MKVSKSSTENKKGFKFGFTLAEVLITLGIIGVVAAITMPMLITNVRNHVRAKRIENIEQKFSKATDKMVALGVYTGHSSTQEFVNELGKHLKLAKVCDNSNLASCWPYAEVQLSDGKMWKIADTKKAKNMKMEDSETATWDDTMGIITADGTSMILSYNTKCAIDDTQRITWSGSVSSTTGCVAVKYDWNGATKPNKDNDDVLAINAGAFGNSCLFEVGGTCYSKIIKSYEPMSYADCEKEKGNLGISECCPYCGDNDYWAGAVRECGHVNKLPSQAQLQAIADYIYAGNPIDRSTSLGLPSEFFGLWSSEEDGSYDAYVFDFDIDSDFPGACSNSNNRPNDYEQVICLD